MNKKADIGGKQTINIYNRAWAEWILQDQEIQVEAELSSEFQFIARASDSLLQVRNKDGQPFLSLTELQLRYAQDMPDRLNAYAALAQHKYKLDVYVTVVYLLAPAAGVRLPTAFHREFMGQLDHRDFQIIGLWELEAEQVLAFGNPVLLPFIPLMRGGNTERMLYECASRIRQEPQALELETNLSVFASYVLDTSLIKRVLRWEMQMIQESPILQEIFVERFEQGKHEATLESLHQILTFRFGVDETYLDEKEFESLDVETLKKLNEIALTVQTLTEFENALSEFEKQVY